MPDKDDDDRTDQQVESSKDRESTGDALSRESRERVQHGGEPDTDALGNADGAS